MKFSLAERIKVGQPSSRLNKKNKYPLVLRHLLHSIYISEEIALRDKTLEASGNTTNHLLVTPSRLTPVWNVTSATNANTSTREEYILFDGVLLGICL